MRMLSGAAHSFGEIPPLWGLNARIDEYLNKDLEGFTLYTNVFDYKL
jgi:hypothetical protein